MLPFRENEVEIVKEVISQIPSLNRSLVALALLFTLQVFKNYSVPYLLFWLHAWNIKPAFLWKNDFIALQLFRGRSVLSTSQNCI